MRMEKLGVATTAVVTVALTLESLASMVLWLQSGGEHDDDAWEPDDRTSPTTRAPKQDTRGSARHNA